MDFSEYVCVRVHIYKKCKQAFKQEHSHFRKYPNGNLQ